MESRDPPGLFALGIVWSFKYVVSSRESERDRQGVVVVVGEGICERAPMRNGVSLFRITKLYWSPWWWGQRRKGPKTFVSPLVTLSTSLTVSRWVMQGKGDVMHGANHQIRIPRAGRVMCFGFSPTAAN